MTNPITSNTLLTDSILVLIGFISSFDVNVGYGYGVAYYIGVSLSILHPHFITFYVHFLVPLKTVFFYDLLSLMWLALLGGVIIFFQSQPAPRTPAPQPAEGDSPDVPDDDDGWPAWLRRLLRILAIIGVSVAVIGLVIWFWVNFGTPSVPVPPASPVPLDIPPVPPVPVDIPIPPAGISPSDLPKVFLVTVAPELLTTSGKFNFLTALSTTQPDLTVLVSLLNAITGTTDEIAAQLHQTVSFLSHYFDSDQVFTIATFLAEAVVTDMAAEARELLLLLLKFLSDELGLTGVRRFDFQGLHNLATSMFNTILNQIGFPDTYLRQLVLLHLHDAVDGVARIPNFHTQPLHMLNSVFEHFRFISVGVHQVVLQTDFRTLAYLLTDFLDRPTADIESQLDALRVTILERRLFTADQQRFFLDILAVFPEVMQVEFTTRLPLLTHTSTRTTLVELVTLLDQLNFLRIVGVDMLPITLPFELREDFLERSDLLGEQLGGADWSSFLSSQVSPDVRVVLTDLEGAMRWLQEFYKHVNLGTHAIFKLV